MVSGTLGPRSRVPDCYNYAFRDPSAFMNLGPGSRVPDYIIMVFGPDGSHTIMVPHSIVAL